MTCLDALRDAYRLWGHASGERSALIETALGLPADADPVASDDLRDEQRLYHALFSDECRLEVLRLYEACRDWIRKEPFDSATEAIDAIQVLQGLLARALWKHGCDIGDELKEFTRDFDRLDLADERRRLHASVRARDGNVAD